MSAVHHFKQENNAYRWEYVPALTLEQEGILGAVKNVLIGEHEGAPHFIMRYFELEPAGHSKLERHVQEHVVIVLRGKGMVQIAEEKHAVSAFDAVFITGDELHQFSNPYAEPFGFVCVIPRLDG